MNMDRFYFDLFFAMAGFLILVGGFFFVTKFRLKKLETEINDHVSLLRDISKRLTYIEGKIDFLTTKFFKNEEC